MLLIEYCKDFSHVSIN